MLIWGATDKGKSRAGNQDAYQIIRNEDDTGLCVVCDGMGGARAGDVASKVACETFCDEIKRRTKHNMSIASMRSAMIGAGEIANRVVFQMSNTNAEYSGMGTTLVAAMISGDEVLVMNIGDSRAYLLTNNKLSRITRDHSLAEDMLLSGGLTPEQARNYPGKNLITRALGTEMTIEGDFYPLKMLPGDCLLLCTDGLSNMLEDADIERVLTENVDLGSCCDKLVDFANERGGLDNITVALIAF